MTTKKFLIQFESSPSTRWLYNDTDFARVLTVLSQSAAQHRTQGPLPRVTVTVEEMPAPESESFPITYRHD